MSSSGTSSGAGSASTFFNITNTPYFQNPNGTFLSATFGQITSTMPGSERTMRFGFRTTF